MFRIGNKKIRLLIGLALLSLLTQGLTLASPVAGRTATQTSSVQAAKQQQTNLVETPDPTSVTLVGSLQSELGCSGDWQPDCTATYLSYDSTDDVWQGTFNVPAGNWEYKVALNNSWAENYGLHAQRDGPNIPLNLASPTSVKFYYDHKSHWITDNVNSVIATIPGSFQSELGCTGDWDPGCLRSWLQDPDGDNTYSFDTTALPAGNYEAKVAINESWAENYGQGGVPGGANIPFTVPFDNALVRFRYDPNSHILTIVTGHSHDNNVEYNGLGHNSQDTIYRQPGGAVTPNTPITLRFRTFHDDVTRVFTRFYDTATSAESYQDMQIAAADVSCYDLALAGNTCDFWQTVYTPTQPTTLYYRFIITDGSAAAYYADDNMMDGGWGTPTPNLIDNSYDVTVYSSSFQSIDWLKNAVIYQIFPDRFRNGLTSNDPTGNEPRYGYPSDLADQILHPLWSALPEGYCVHYVNPGQQCNEGPRGRDYFGGDLKGVDQELGYLQSLGVNTLYFNPIFDSASNHGYDTQNYFQIDPFFGTQKDWQNLAKDADQRGMHIILDGVFNHVSSDSIYFDRYHHFSTVGACESVSSPYRSWFTFHDQSNGPCAGPNGPNTMTYDDWAGFDSLPVLNKSVQAVRDLIYAQGNNSVAPYWLNKGAHGWRLDVMSDASFPPDYWQQFRAVVKSANPAAPIIGEMWKKSDVLPMIHGDQADTTMNYRFRNAVMGLFGTVDHKGFPDDGQSDEPPSLFASKMSSIREDYPDATYYTAMNLVDSHDTERILWSLTPGAYNREDREFNAQNLAEGKQMLRLADIVQFTVPGAPTIFYGDEVGMTGSDDPDDRRTFPWAGNAPGGDPAVRAFYQQLATIRNSNGVLRNGALTFLLTDDANHTLAYGMKNSNRVAIVAINRDNDHEQTLTIPLVGYLRDGVAFTDALSGAGATSTGGSLSVTLPALGGAIFISNQSQDLNPPSTPHNLTATPGNHQVALSWPAVTGAAGYKVYRSQVSGGGYVYVGNASGAAYTDSTSDNARRYYYVVTSLDSLGNESGWSDEAQAVPSAPIGWAGHLWPTALNITINAEQIQTVYAQVWADGVTNQPGQGAGVLAQFAYGPVGSDPTTWTWSPMVYNTDVGNNDEYKIDFTPEQTDTFQYLARFSTNLGNDWTYAYTDDSHRGSLTVNSSGDTTAPAAPTNLHSVDRASLSITPGWNANSEQDLYRYEVWRSATSGGPYAKIADVLTPTTQYIDRFVYPGATYYYVVTAQDNSFNRSGNSNEVSIQAIPPTVAVTFNITVPASTDGTGRMLHIAGDFPPLSGYPQWDPTSPQLQATRVDATHWTITLNLADGTPLQYKYALADWNYVEKGASCEELNNRQVTISGSGGTQTVNDTVLNWRNVSPCGN